MKHLFLLLLLAFSTLNLLADEDGTFKVVGDIAYFSEKKPFSDIEVTVNQVDQKGRFGVVVDKMEVLQTLKVSKKGSFEAHLKFGSYYRIVISKPGYLSLFFDVDATKVPDKDYDMVEGFSQLITLLREDEKPEIAPGRKIKVEMFAKYPFEVFNYNASKKSFLTDKVYETNFQNGLEKNLVTGPDKKKLDEKKKLDAIKAKEEEEAKKKAAMEALMGQERTFTFKLLYKDNMQPFSLAEITFTEESTGNVRILKATGFGKFTVDKVKLNSKYQIKGKTSLGKEGTGIVLTNRFNNKASETVTTAGGEFLFNWPPDETQVKLLETTNTGVKVMSGNVMVGDVSKEPLGNVSVLLKDEGGNLLQQTRTNELGGFIFNYLSEDKNYIVELDEVDPALVGNKKVSIVNKQGKEVVVLNKGANGKFSYSILSSDETVLTLLDADEADLKIRLKGKFYKDEAKTAPIANIKVFLVSRTGEQLQYTVTDNAGFFDFKNLPGDISYLISLDETDPSLKSVTKVIMTDERGGNAKEMVRNSSNKFSYEVLPSDLTFLAEVAVEEPWLNLSKASKSTPLTIAESVYFKANDFAIMPDAATVLNKIAVVLKSNKTVRIELGSHSDSNGSDVYNMDLSKKRANAAKEYLVSKGVDASRITAVGYGETKIKNHCLNGVKCSDAEHAQNRRIEFKVLTQ